MLARWRENKTVASVVAILSIPSAILLAAGAIESVWSLFRDEPLIPLLGPWLRSAVDEAMKVLAVVALLALAIYMIQVQRGIAASLRTVGDVLPEGVTWAEGAVVAGSDTNFDLTDPTAKTARSVTFTALQGRRVIADDKPGVVDYQRELFRLTFTALETLKLKDGYVLIQATIVDDQGQRSMSHRLAVKTVGPLKSLRR